MTQVANRAEFDRVHAMFVAAHQQQQVPCSLLMCDLDRFKLVNDNYGHQAGDDVIKSLASLLKSSCRPGDLVARYGGEEFVVLCADCDNASAARRAKQICKALSQIPQPKMGGRAVTVSIGVTEVQPGDTPETMLRRADRALLMAKAAGRNTVIQLGSGIGSENGVDPGEFPVVQIRPLQRSIRAASGHAGAGEDRGRKAARLRGRSSGADHRRQRQPGADGDQRQAGGRIRRLTDRPATFCLDVQMEEDTDGTARPRPARRGRRSRSPSARGETRNRRQSEVTAKARELLISFRSYLMATECDLMPSSGVINRVKRMFTPWLAPQVDRTRNVALKEWPTAGGELRANAADLVKSPHLLRTYRAASTSWVSTALKRRAIQVKSHNILDLSLSMFSPRGLASPIPRAPSIRVFAESGGFFRPADDFARTSPSSTAALLAGNEATLRTAMPMPEASVNEDGLSCVGGKTRSGEPGSDRT